MITSILNQKTHIIYGVIIVCLAALAYNMFTKKPVTITKTEVVTKVVTKEVVKRVLVHQNIVSNKRIETRKPDGTTIIETDNVVNTGVIDSSKIDKIKSDTTKTTKEVQSFLSRYTITGLYTSPILDIVNPTLNPANFQIIGGMRVFNLPVLLNVGTTGNLEKLSVGLTIEL